MILNLTIKPIEALQLTRGTVGGVDVFSVTETSYAPLPTTIIGLLANVYCEVSGDSTLCNLPKQSDCLTSLREVINKLGIEYVWGPLINVSDKQYFITEDKLIPLDKAADYVNAVVYMGCKDECVSGILNNELLMFKTIDKVGIAIDREARTVRPGFTYRQRFIWLRKINESGSVETVRDWGYQYLIKLGKGDVLKGARVVMRVGGEGRQAIVELVSASEDIPRAETGGGVTYGVVLSPVVFDGDAPFINVEQVDKDIELVYGLLSEGGVRQRVMTASLGFSEAAKCRRPIYPAMPPGTVVRLKVPRTHVGLFTNYGYGSILAVSGV